MSVRWMVFKVEMSREGGREKESEQDMRKNRVLRFECNACGEIASREVLVSWWDRRDICRNTDGSLFQRGGKSMAVG